MLIGVLVIVVVAVLFVAGFFVPPVRVWILTRGAPPNAEPSRRVSRARRTDD